MTISINSQFSHPVCNGNVHNAGEVPTEKIKTLLNDLVINNSNISESDVNWNGDQIELGKVSALQLHTFLLEAEKLGLNIQMEKKTLIKLS